MSASDKGWMAGVVYAAGWLCVAHGEDGLAEGLLQTAGLETAKACREAGADQYDITCAKPALQSLVTRARLNRSRRATEA